MVNSIVNKIILKIKKMNTNNINQIFKKVIKNLSIVGVSLSIFNTYSN